MAELTIPVLTIKQPWAHLIMHGGKDIENRDWPTKVRGRIAIHSSAKLDMNEVFSAMRHIADHVPSRYSFHTDELIAGHILGTVELVDCVTASDSPWFMGEYGFVLRDPRPLAKPIPAKGSLGFWHFPVERFKPAPSPGGGK